MNGLCVRKHFFQCADKNVYFYAFICPPHWYHFNQLFFLQNSVLSFALSPKSLKSRRCSFPIFARFLSFAFNPLKLLPLNLISNVRLNTVSVFWRAQSHLLTLSTNLHRAAATLCMWITVMTLISQKRAESLLAETFGILSIKQMFQELPELQMFQFFL